MLNEYLSIKEASERLNVSEATCRNWIKAKTLEIKKEGTQIYVLASSVSKLLENNINGKLSSRRNKTKKSGNVLSLNYLSNKEHQNLVLEIIKKVDNVESFDEIKVILKHCALIQMKLANKLNDDGLKLLKDLCDIDNADSKYDFEVDYLILDDDILGALYMCLKRISDRKSGGMYYTPSHIVDSMFDNLLQKNFNFEDKTIIDICCGTGNFLIKALEYSFKPTNIYGNDFDEVSVALARINLFLRTDLTYNQLVKQITFSDSLSADFDEFDFCVGNPPWGSELSIPFNEIFGKFQVAETKSVDPFCLFIEKGMRITKSNGCLYYVCPEALCNVGIHKPARQYLQKNCSLLFLEYLGNAFDGVQTPAITICLKKEKVNNFCANSFVKYSNTSYTVSKNRIVNSELWDLNISTEYYEIIERILKRNDIRFLKDNADFALGIVTGDNKKYVLTEPTLNSSNLVKGSNVYKYSLAVDNFYLEYDRNKFQQVAPDEYYFAKEKLIYRFISDTLVFTYDDKQTLTLNSANICIPMFKDIPMKYILAILNSRLSHFIFKLKFNSIKVLRNHIESLPLIIPNQEKIETVVNFVNQLLCTTDPIKKNNLYNDLDDIILDIYELSNTEKQIVTNFNKNNIFLN